MVGRKEKKTVKTEARRLMGIKAAQQNKNLSEELKQGLPAQFMQERILKRFLFVSVKGKLLRH